MEESPYSDVFDDIPENNEFDPLNLESWSSASYVPLLVLVVIFAGKLLSAYMVKSTELI
tara:strand:+ start:150 stop:326 length:177 start_codon:yes stop_codon:yes gene_type:complete